MTFEIALVSIAAALATMISFIALRLCKAASAADDIGTGTETPHPYLRELQTREQYERDCI